MKLSRNALGNLINRYRAVLKKCRLLNVLGTLLLAGGCVCGGLLACPQEVAAGPLSPDGGWTTDGQVTGKTLTVNRNADGIFGGFAFTNDTFGLSNQKATNNTVTIISGNFGHYEHPGTWIKAPSVSVAGGLSNYESNNNSVTINGGYFSGGGIYGGYSNIGSKNTAVYSNENTVKINMASGNIDIIAGGYSQGQNSTANGNNITINTDLTVNGMETTPPFASSTTKVAVIGGFSQSESSNNTVNISNGTFNGVVVGGAATQKGATAHNNTINITGGKFIETPVESYNAAIIGAYVNFRGNVKNNIINISGNAEIKGDIYAAYIRSEAGPADEKISGELNIKGGEFIDSSLYGYNSSTNDSNIDSAEFILSIDSFSGDINHIGQFSSTAVTNSSLKVGTVDCLVETKNIQDTSFTGNNSNITIGSITRFKKLDIKNTIHQTVKINKIYGLGGSTVSIQSGKVILRDIDTLYGKGDFCINDAPTSDKFTTQITGNLNAKNAGSISAGFHTADSVLKGKANKNTGKIDLTFSSGALWSMTDSSSVSSLTLKNDGTVDMTHGRAAPVSSGFRTLHLDTLKGSGGIFKVDTNLADGNTDQIIIDNASGAHGILVRSSGTEPGSAATDFIVQQKAGTAAFSLSNDGGKVDAGIYTYTLSERATDTSGGKEWYLQRTGGEKSPTGETVLGLSGMASAYAMYMGQLSDLRERLGEIRHGNGTDGLWVRGFTEENRLSGLGGVDFSQNFYGTSFGYDRLLEQDENNSWLLGLRGQITKADQRIDGLHDGSGDSRSYGVAAYATWQHKDGWYADTVLSWDWYDQNLKTRMLDGTRVHGSYNTFGGGISQELGRTFSFDNGFFVEPQLQLSWYWMKGTDFTTSNGMDVDQDDMYALTGRAGLVLGKKWDLDEGRFFQPYLKAGVNHEFLGDQKVRVNGIEFTDDLRGTRGYYGAGLDLQFASNARFYAEFEREDGQKASTPWSVSAGLRVEF